ncbi:GNAT family N-acetyltransferase [Aliikangiella sp. G2MR2-5]|uniref:GNAT family N-acetyltransferase n=1 Tax=Aliikangiella sp. G2MR2-5 TaxID=2788943 RepID=UPI0018AB3A62|nr:GNAT family N-acetyltransferase [Aliikangiella sp. G2MR2-5]
MKSIKFIEVAPIEFELHLHGLSELLIACVDQGASIGFLPPLSQTDANEYWTSLESSLVNRTRRLMIVLIEEEIIGSIQLNLCQKENGLHRADLEKLIVLPSHRGAGVGKMLLKEAESLALSLGRHMLILDTRKGDVASNMYEKYGYIKVGEIPDFVVETNGQWSATVYYYKSLKEELLKEAC